MSAMPSGGGGAGYDISQSTSESATQGFNTKMGNFSVGGGMKFPQWVWLVAAALSVFIVWKKFGK